VKIGWKILGGKRDVVCKKESARVKPNVVRVDY